MTFRLTVLFVALASGAAAADGLPSVASINLCTDQLVLSLADPEQILTLSWLSADSEESMLAESARAFPANYGSAEELLAFAPDVILGGTFTNAFTRRLLADLGYTVVEIAPAASLAQIERNIRQVAAAIGQRVRAERVIEAMRRRASSIADRRPRTRVPAIVIRPGGFTAGAGTLADELLGLAGFRNIAAETGLDRWGSLSMETLIRSRPELVVLTDYRLDESSLANAVFGHPAVASLRQRTRSATIAAKFWACGVPASLASAEILQGSLKAPQPQ